MSPPRRRLESLADDLDARAPLSPARTLEWLTPVARAMESAHAAGRTIGTFGPADLVSARPLDEALEVIVGAQRSDVIVRRGLTPRDAYAAPELASGAPASPASDIYSLAAVAFECLTGRPPLADRAITGARTTDVVEAAIYGEEAPEEAILRAALRLSLARALEPDPSRRERAPAAVLARIARAQRSS